VAKYTDSISNLWNIPELEKEHAIATGMLKKWLAEVTAASKKMREMQLGVLGGGNLQAMRASAKEVEALTNQQIKSIKALADAKLKEAKAEEVLSRARLNAARQQAIEDKKTIVNQKELERQARINAKALEDLAKKQEKAAQAAAKESNEYEKLKRQYKSAADEAKRLGAVLGTENAQFKAAAASAHALHTQLLNIEMAVGQAQRQVGNYNVVGMQFQQLLRELPNAGISARTFIMAISNNITYFAESVSDARKQGMSWGAVLKTLGGSLFSVVGIINIAVTALTFITTWMTKSESATKGAKDETNEYADAVQRVIDKERELAELRKDKFNGGSEAALKREIDLLKAQGASDAEIFEAEQRYFKARAENLRDEADTYNTLIKETDRYFKFYDNGKRTQEEIDEKVTQKLIKTLQEYTTISAKEAEGQAKAIVEGYGQQGGAFAELNAKRLQLLSDAKNAENELNVNSIEFQKKLTEDIAKDDEKALKEAEQRLKDYYKRIRDTEKERGGMGFLPSTQDIQAQIKEIENQNLANRLQQALFNTDRDENFAQQELEKQFAAGLITAEQYEAEKLRIKNDYDTKRIQLEIETNKKLLANGGMAEEERLKTIARMGELELELAKDGNAEKLKAEEDYKKASLRIEEERAQRIKQIRQELTNTAIQFASFLIEREREQLNEKKQRIEDEKQLEIARIDATSSTDEEAARRKFALEQSVLQQKQQIQKREEQLERNRFLLEQAGALARVLINANESVAKIQAQASVLASNPVTAGLAAGALAQIPVVYGSAAVQAGLIAAQTLAYAEGTPEGGHKGGNALVGEAGEAEYVKEPGKAGYWVTKPTFYKDMPKGTEVTPLHKLEAGNIDRMDMKAINAIMLQGGGNSERTESILMEAVSELKEIKKKPQSNWIVKGNAMYEIVTRGNSKNIKLGKNFID
jgi:hypothetical protein